MKQQHPPSHLFTLRLWQEELNGGQTEWRGQLQHVLSGDTCYFRHWPGLVAQLQEMLWALEMEPDKGGVDGSQEESGT